MVNIGVLGCSSFAERFVLPNILELPEYFKLVGIASRSHDKASQCAFKYHTTAYSPYESILDISGIDAIYIPLPNSLHEEWIQKALNRGLHVLVEKPLATNAEAVRALNDFAKSRSLVLLETFQFRFHSQLNWIMDKLQEGIIGDLRCIRSSFGFPPFPDPSNIRYCKELGGGSLLDAGVYPIKISQIFLGNAVSVTSACLHVDAKKGVDTWGGGFLKQKHGDLFSEIAFGFENHYQCSLDLWGSEGRLYTNRIFTAPPGFKPEVTIEQGSKKDIISLPEDNHFKNMLMNFYHQIETKGDTHYQQNIDQAVLIDEFLRLSNR
ncbi:MAG TPA: Gfo/Idh/MocA family oxidoreductase [Candidatus Cloacimonadota bacterium]|nr:Gfo/Idh/MocA family oxidoreductase [Candidatus Cloacimonadota bacterium]